MTFGRSGLKERRSNLPGLRKGSDVTQVTEPIKAVSPYDVPAGKGPGVAEEIHLFGEDSVPG